jgi:hypothetical protein
MSLTHGAQHKFRVVRLPTRANRFYVLMTQHSPARTFLGNTMATRHHLYRTPMHVLLPL